MKLNIKTTICPRSRSQFLPLSPDLRSELALLFNSCQEIFLHPLCPCYVRALALFLDGGSLRGSCRVSGTAKNNYTHPIGWQHGAPSAYVMRRRDEWKPGESLVHVLCELHRLTEQWSWNAADSVHQEASTKQSKDRLEASRPAQGTGSRRSPTRTGEVYRIY